MSLQWDAWPNTAQDFDLYIEDDHGNIVASSERRPERVGRERPADRVRHRHEHVAVEDRIYFVLVNRCAGTARAAHGPLLRRRRVRRSRHPRRARSPTRPSSRGAMTVGAHCYGDGAIEPYSSRGPDHRRTGEARHLRPRRHLEQRLRRGRRVLEHRVLRHLGRGTPRGGSRRPGPRGEPGPRRRRAAAAARATGPSRPARRARQRPTAPDALRLGPLGDALPAGAPGLHPHGTRPACSTAGRAPSTPARPRTGPRPSAGGTASRVVVRGIGTGVPADAIGRRR